MLFDFNNSASPTQTGYTGISPTTALYSTGQGYGWDGQAPPYSFNYAISGPTNIDLLRDGQQGLAGAANARTFKVDLAAGDYQVTVTMGNLFTHNDMRIAANGTVVDGDVDAAGGQYVTRTFTVHTDMNGQIALTFDDAGSSSWVVNAISFRQSPVTQLNITPPGGSLTADGTTVDTFTVSGTASGKEYTISTTAGTIVTVGGNPVADVDSNYAGIQILGTGSDITIGVQRPSAAANATLTVEEVSGAAVGNATVAYTGPTQFRYDFNSGSSPTQSGFTGVQNSQLFNATSGYGWQTSTPYGFNYATSTGTSAQNLDQDGATSSTAQTFEIQASANQTYDIRVYTGTVIFSRPPLNVSVSGGTGTGGTSASNHSAGTAGGTFTTVEVDSVTTDASGILHVTLSDFSGSYPWAVNGIDVALHGSLPAQPLLVTGAAQNESGTALTTGELQPIVDAAVTRLTAAGWDTSVLATTQVRVAALDGELGQAASNVVLIDDNAAGYGWFVDSTPYDDAEFTPTAGDELQATGGAAAGGVDLLTVVMHELTHIMGGVDLNPAVYPHELMTDSLGIGIRRLPESGVPQSPASAPASSQPQNLVAAPGGQAAFYLPTISTASVPSTNTAAATTGVAIASPAKSADSQSSSKAHQPIVSEIGRSTNQVADPAETAALDDVFSELTQSQLGSQTLWNQIQA